LLREIIKIDRRFTLGDLYTPWRANSDGSYADGRHPNATPLQVKTEQFPEKVENELKPHADQSISMPFYFPCYALENTKFLVLDCNHRLVNIYRNKQEVDLCAWVIVGPINRYILPDLEHWE
jgi:hypothetical protein